MMLRSPQPTACLPDARPFLRQLTCLAVGTCSQGMADSVASGKGSTGAAPENRSGWRIIPLAKGQSARYSIFNEPVRPLPQGTHTSAGVFLRGGLR